MSPSRLRNCAFHAHVEQNDVNRSWLLGFSFSFLFLCFNSKTHASLAQDLSLLCDVLSSMITCYWHFRNKLRDQESVVGQQDLKKKIIVVRFHKKASLAV